jgi:hypothetical protein
MEKLGSVGTRFTLTHVSNVSANNLANVGSTFSVSETQLQTLSLPALKSSGLDMIIRSNPSLSSLSFPALETIQGTLSIANNTDMAISLNSLREVRGSIDISNNVNSFEVPKLERLDGALKVSGKGFNCPSLDEMKV